MIEESKIFNDYLQRNVCTFSNYRSAAYGNQQISVAAQHLVSCMRADNSIIFMVLMGSHYKPNNIGLFSVLNPKTVMHYLMVDVSVKHNHMLLYLKMMLRYGGKIFASIEKNDQLMNIQRHIQDADQKNSRFNVENDELRKHSIILNNWVREADEQQPYSLLYSLISNNCHESLISVVIEHLQNNLSSEAVVIEDLCECLLVKYKVSKDDFRDLRSSSSTYFTDYIGGIGFVNEDNIRLEIEPIQKDRLHFSFIFNKENVFSRNLLDLLISGIKFKFGNDSNFEIQNLANLCFSKALKVIDFDSDLSNPNNKRSKINDVGLQKKFRLIDASSILYSLVDNISPDNMVNMFKIVIEEYLLNKKLGIKDCDFNGVMFMTIRLFAEMSVEQRQQILDNPKYEVLRDYLSTNKLRNFVVTLSSMAKHMTHSKEACNFEQSALIKFLLVGKFLDGCMENRVRINIYYIFFRKITDKVLDADPKLLDIKISEQFIRQNFSLLDIKTQQSYIEKEVFSTNLYTLELIEELIKNSSSQSNSKIKLR